MNRLMRNMELKSPKTQESRNHTHKGRKRAGLAAEASEQATPGAEMNMTGLQEPKQGRSHWGVKGGT